MKTITAMICITVLVGFANYRGIDGALLGIAIAAISGLGGFAIKKLPFFK